jgi:signal transduction histidine kinase
MVEDIFDIPMGATGKDLAAALTERGDVIRARLHARLMSVLEDADAIAQLVEADCLRRVIHNLSVNGDPKPRPDLAAGPGEYAYCLRDVITAYGALRLILIDEAPAGLGRALRVDELATLNLAVSNVAHAHILECAARSVQDIRAQTAVYAHHLSFLSHELHGGLNGVLMMLEVLKHDLGHQKRFAGAVNDLRLLQQSIFETVGAMDSLIEVDRFEFDELSTKLERIDAAKVTEEVARRFEPWAAARGLRLEIQMVPEVQVKTDRPLLTLILQQLIANAVKFAASGTVKVIAEPIGNGAARIAVVDEGHGLTPAELASLVSSPETGMDKGVESRLAIARKTAELLRARLRAESRPGGPNVLILELPPR